MVERDSVLYDRSKEVREMSGTNVFIDFADGWLYPTRFTVACTMRMYYWSNCALEPSFISIDTLSSERHNFRGS